MILALILVYITGTVLTGFLCGLVGEDEQQAEAFMFAWPVALVAVLVLLWPYKLGQKLRGFKHGG